MQELSEQELVRRNKLEEMKKQGINPFKGAIDVKNNSKEIYELYDNFSKEELAEMNILVVIAGRIMTKRGKGKVTFAHIQDKYGQIQIYVKLDDIGEANYKMVENADLGDIVGIYGRVFRTNTGELSIHTNEFIHLSKALRPLPEKYHGLVDLEERYRRRYVDLICNEDARKIAFMRPKIIRAIQRYLDNLEYTEVETPILGSVLGGAAAKPFITHHNKLDQDMYLRIATELPLKRLIVGGMDAVYEIGRLFRNEGTDKKHNPEFTTIEVYKAYSDMLGMMDLTEELIRYTMKETINTLNINWKEHDLDFAKPFKRIHMVEAIKNVCNIDFFKEYTFEEAIKIAKEHNIVVEKHFTIGHIINAFFEKYVEETIIEPTFVYGHPLEISPLAKKNEKDPRFTERFELFICGDEYANAFSELNDPIDQKERFENQLKEKDLGNLEANEMDEDYIEALEYGMPPCGGMGMGIDRLVMLITGSLNIREVILFPQMKNKN
ncbi:MAG: lysine--tRNA ligase [Bacilli bacterium]